MLGIDSLILDGMPDMIFVFFMIFEFIAAGITIKLPASITFKPSKSNFSDMDKYYTRTRTHCRKVLSL